MKQTKNIEVVSYNLDWPKMFEAEASRIKNGYKVYLRANGVARADPCVRPC